MRRAYAYHRPVENAYLVRQRDQRLLRELLGVFAVVLLLGGGLFAYTWIHVETLRTGYRVDQLEKELHTLLEKERYLRLEVARRTHPEQLETRARQELGMVYPGVEQIFHFEDLLTADPQRARRLSPEDAP